MAERIYQQKKRIYAAEADAERSRKVLVSTKNQVCPPIGLKRKCANPETCQLAPLEERLSSKQSKINELSCALDRKEEELQKSTTQCSRLNERISSLERNVHRFRARCDRAEEKRSHAVEAAIDRTRKQFESANSRRVKRPDGRIEDWVRDLVVELVSLDGVPTEKVPQVIERVRRSFIAEETSKSDGRTGGNSKKEMISDRSVRRILVEVYVKAFLRAGELFHRAPCQCQNSCYLIGNKLTLSDIPIESMDSEWGQHLA